MKESNLNKLLNNDEEIDLTLSYSRISDFDRNGPRALLQKTALSNEGIKHGSLVDDLLYDKLTNNKTFDEKYFIFQGNKPTASLGELCDIILENYDKLPNKNTILKIVKNNAFWSRTKEDEKLISYFDKSEFWDYLNIMFEVNDRKVITYNEFLLAKESVITLLEHSHSKELFNNNYENHYQLPFEIKYKGFKIKGILDQLSIDHNNKIVYMTDLKTGQSKAENFMKSFIDYRYYFQGCIYLKSFNYFKEQFNLEGYELAPFKFLYIGKNEKIPHIFTFTEKWNNAALKGFTTKSGYKYVGLDENLDKIYFHWKNNIFNISKELYEQNGSLTLNDDFIEVND